MEAITFLYSEAGERLGDWRAIESLYGQLSALKGGRDASAPAVAAVVDRLAEAIAQVFAAYEDCEEDFLSHLCGTMVSIDGIIGNDRERFTRLYKDEALKPFEVFNPGDRKLKGKPKPFEAAVETVRRITDLNRIRGRLEPLGTTAILGGSLSFGRFFSIYGGFSERPSDIDLILVVQNYRDIKKVVRELREVRDGNDKRFIDKAGLDEMETRARSFNDWLGKWGGRTIFQQKLNLWEGEDSEYFYPIKLPIPYRIAIQIVSPDDLDHLLLREYARLSEMPAEPRTIQVYRNDPASSTSEDQFCFAGLHRESPVLCEEAEGGYRSQVQVSEIFEGRFYPGVHLSLIFPQFEVRWEDKELRTRLQLQALRYKFIARLQDERALHPFDVQKLSFAHARSRQFARRVTERLDSE